MEPSPIKTSQPQQERRVEITEETLMKVARESDYDQLALVIFHDCITAGNNKDGIEYVRRKIDKIRADERKRVIERAKALFQCSCGEEQTHYVGCQLSQEALRRLSKDL